MIHEEEHPSLGVLLLSSQLSNPNTIEPSPQSGLQVEGDPEQIHPESITQDEQPSKLLAF